MPSAVRFFALCRPAMQPPQSYSESEDHAALGNLQAGVASARAGFLFSQHGGTPIIQRISTAAAEEHDLETLQSSYTMWIVFSSRLRTHDVKMEL
ncbi:UNVERIFIED_CONTAM: hypothetical protein FKN15_027450 [Acipenser sinensis]